MNNSIQSGFQARSVVTGRRTSAALLSALIGIGLLSPSPAFATESQFDPGEPVDTIEAVVPEYLDETSSAGPLELSEDGEVLLPDTPSEEGSSASGVTFTIDYAQHDADSPPDDDGLVEFEGEEDGVSAVLQSTSFGARVFTVISEASAPTEYQYTFDVPEGTALVEDAAGFSLETGDDILGTLLDPWAVDANGQPVATSYSWNDGVLTQHVDLSRSNIAYPVVADPAWSYAYKFSTTKTATKNASLLKSCFNCYFPVKGAPRSFPKVGQLLPLKVGVANMECRFKSQFSGTNYFGFQFDATKNHVDKAGSNIIFQFKTIGGKKYLTVNAYIKNDAFWVKNAFYRSGAISTWKQFAANLNKA